MKYLLLLIAILLPYILFSQEDTFKKNSVYLVGGISLGGNILSSSGFNTTLAYHSINLPNRRSRTSLDINYTGGIDYQRYLTKGISLKLGARFSRWGYKYKFDSSKNFPINDKRTIGINYIEIPIAVVYEFKSKKLKPYIQIGIAPMIYSSHTPDLRYLHSALKEVTFSIHLATGISYQFFNHYFLFAHVIGKIQPIPMHTHEIFSEHLYNCGLEIGLGVNL
jgi:hypothetical protein